MDTDIRAWQILDGDLENIDSTLATENRLEADLESWIAENEGLLGEGILLIGNQVNTRTGPVDFLCIDASGDLVVVELKRGRLPRKSLAQAIDYASDISMWDLEEIDEVCEGYKGQNLEDYLNEAEIFDQIDIEELVFNQAQRILLVGFSIDESLQRMIEWLSQNYGLSINAVALRYFKTSSGDEILARTKVISEEEEEKRSRKKAFQIEMSDSPGEYDAEELEQLLTNYFSQDRKTPQRVKELLLPICLDKGVVTRDEIKKELVTQGQAENEGKAGIILTTISREIGIKKRDYLRQIIDYERPSHSWEKDNYRIRSGGPSEGDLTYQELVQEVIGSS